jgi:hypothetical protein
MKVGRATIDCKKSEIELGSPNGRILLFLRPYASVARGEGESLDKFFLPFFPHNPLKRLDSDERIQGNPRDSNTLEVRFSRRKSDKPRQSKRDRMLLLLQLISA